MVISRSGARRMSVFRVIITLGVGAVSGPQKMSLPTNDLDFDLEQGGPFARCALGRHFGERSL